MELGANKAIRDEVDYVEDGWVKDVFHFKLSNGIVLVNSIVHHEQAARNLLVKHLVCDCY